MVGPGFEQRWLDSKVWAFNSCLTLLLQLKKLGKYGIKKGENPAHRIPGEFVMESQPI